MVIPEMGHGKHLDCSMFPNHLYNTESVSQPYSGGFAASAFPPPCLLAPSLFLLPFPSACHRPSLISYFLSLCNFSSSASFTSQIMVAGVFCCFFQIRQQILGNEPATVYSPVLGFAPHQFCAPEELFSNRPEIQPKHLF